MTDQLEELHAAAGLGLLRADAVLTVHDGRVPDGAEPPYVLVYTIISWPAGEQGQANPLTGDSVTCRAELYCHCVGATASAARAVQARVRAALLGTRPTVAGRNCGLIRQGEALAPTRDETTGRLLMDAVVTYYWISTP